MDGPGSSIQLYDAISSQSVMRVASVFSSELSTILAIEMLSRNAPNGGATEGWIGSTERDVKLRLCHGTIYLPREFEYDMLTEFCDRSTGL